MASNHEEACQDNDATSLGGHENGTKVCDIETKELTVPIRYDWYQTDTSVVITVMMKNLKPNAVDVKMTPTTVDFAARFPSHPDYNLHLNLSSVILPERSTWKQFSSKVEIKLCKSDGFRWNSLEGNSEVVKQPPAALATGGSEANVPTYPSSSIQKRDWDRIAVDIEKTEEEEEKNVSGEAAVNKLFQKIYSEGSEEVRRAMNKSFMESGGTVLSTNWNEVGQKQVEVKPPDGMEYRQWEH